MSRPRKLDIQIGTEYGWLTVLSTAKKDMYGHIRYNVRCRCGKEYVVQRGFLAKPEPKCADCSHAHDFQKMRRSKIGDIINGWQLLEEVGKNKRGAILYCCRCLKCGKDSIRTRGDLTQRHGQGCQNCQPDYHFCIDGETAVGTLPDGNQFRIDAALIDEVSKYRWGINSKGYIRRTSRGTKLMLHWLALGYMTSPEVCIDHINRDKLDCRKSNLRIVTQQQNAMNRSLQRNNTTGYVGVSFVKNRGIYMAKIGLNDRDITLGTSKDPIRCAQMYNCASKLLFREYAGHRNEVPDAPIDIVQKMERRCRAYLAQSLIATTSYSIAKTA